MVEAEVRLASKSTFKAASMQNFMLVAQCLPCCLIAARLFLLEAFLDVVNKAAPPQDTPCCAYDALQDHLRTIEHLRPKTDLICPALHSKPLQKIRSKKCSKVLIKDEDDYLLPIRLLWS